MLDNIPDHEIRTVLTTAFVCYVEIRERCSYAEAIDKVAELCAVVHQHMLKHPIERKQS